MPAGLLRVVKTLTTIQLFYIVRFHFCFKKDLLKQFVFLLYELWRYVEKLPVT